VSNSLIEEKRIMVKKVCYNITLLFVVVFSAQSGLALATAKPLIVTSTKSLAIIAKSAVANTAAVEYLIPANQSPHDYPLPVSAMEKIDKADLVIWIGPDFEIRGAKVMAKVAEVKLITAINLITHTATQDPSENLHAHSHHDMTNDMHVWLNPYNGNQISHEIQKRLNLPNRDIISQQELDKLSAEMVSARSTTYISHHDAYNHFIQAFALRAGLSIRGAHGGAKGLKTQYQLRKTITETNVSCILVEPHYGIKDVKLIAEEFNLPIIDFDTQGLSQPLTSHGYFEFISSLVTQFKACSG